MVEHTGAYMDIGFYEILVGNALDRLREMPNQSVHCIATSPPYFGLRSYNGGSAEIGIERSPKEYIANLVTVFSECFRVLRDDGILWLNVGDTYAAQKGGSRMPAQTVAGGKGGKGRDEAFRGMGGEEQKPAHRNASAIGFKHKERMGIPHRLVFSLMDSGWTFRDEIVWYKRSTMPESVIDRCTKAHEMVFMLTKKSRYFYDSMAIKDEAAKGASGSKFNEGKTADHLLGRASAKEREEMEFKNKRSVWDIPSQPSIKDDQKHFAMWPQKLVEPMILAGTSAEGCCPKCQAPWVRITKRTKRKRVRPNELTKRTGEAGTGNSCANTVAGVDVETMGWEPSCKCGIAEKIPCTVLDPFLGSGTTVAVAIKHGRRGVGIELNPEYAKMAGRKIEKSISNTYGMFEEIELDLLNSLVSESE